MSRSERVVERYVRDLVAYHGWRRYHTFDSRRSAEGFPNEVLVRASALIFAELRLLSAAADERAGRVAPRAR